MPRRIPDHIGPGENLGNWGGPGGGGAPVTGDFANGGDTAGADRSIGNKDAFDFDIKTNDVVRIYITDTGKVGIGFAPPSDGYGIYQGGTLNADSGFAIGHAAAVTLAAQADNDLLYGLYINPTFNQGVHTGLTERSLYIEKGAVEIKEDGDMLLMGDNSNDVHIVFDPAGDNVAIGCNTNDGILVKKRTNVNNNASFTVKDNGDNIDFQITDTGDWMAKGSFNILDTSSNEIVSLTSIGSAVNELDISNASTGLNPIISAQGETDVGIEITSKGVGPIIGNIDTNEVVRINNTGLGVYTNDPQANLHVIATASPVGSTVTYDFEGQVMAPFVQSGAGDPFNAEAYEQNGSVGSYSAYASGNSFGQTSDSDVTIEVGSGGGNLTYWLYTRSDNDTKMNVLVDDVDLGGGSGLQGNNAWVSRGPYAVNAGTRTITFRHTGSGSGTNRGGFDNVSVTNALGAAPNAALLNGDVSIGSSQGAEPLAISRDHTVPAGNGEGAGLKLTTNITADANNDYMYGALFEPAFTDNAKTGLTKAAIGAEMNALGTTPLNGVLLRNTTAAAAGAQQVSPAIRRECEGYATTPAETQTIIVQDHVLPVEGTTNPTADWKLQFEIDGGGLSDAVVISSDGHIQIIGDINHDGSNIGFFGTAPVAQPAAYTQTYADVTRTHAARTGEALTDNSGGTATTTLAAITGGGADCENATKDAIASLAKELNDLRTDQINTAQVLNQVLDDLQTLGLLQ